MKAILVSEAAFAAIKDRLIADLTLSLEKREDQIRSGQVTGMAASPSGAVNLHVCKAFDALREA